MIHPDTIIARLKSECPSFGGRVYHLARITDVESADDTPAAGVVSRPPRPQEPESISALYHQALYRRFSVAFRGMAPVTAGDDDVMPEVGAEVVLALAGWQPTDDVEIELEAAEEWQPEGNLMTWVYTFAYLDYVRQSR